MDETNCCDRDERELDRVLEAPADELERELQAMAQAIVKTEAGGVERRRFRRSTVEQGRLMAVFSYCSVLFGIPVFLIPMVKRENAFSLHHARSAGVIFLACLAMLVMATVNCALFLPLVFLCYIPALIGIYRASAGVEAGTAACGPAGERIFGRIEVDK